MFYSYTALYIVFFFLLQLFHRAQRQSHALKGTLRRCLVFDHTSLGASHLHALPLLAVTWKEVWCILEIWKKSWKHFIHFNGISEHIWLKTKLKKKGFPNLLPSSWLPGVMAALCPRGKGLWLLLSYGYVCRSYLLSHSVYYWPAFAFCLNWESTQRWNKQQQFKNNLF